MSRRKRDMVDPSGYDSFLDIVANLVGILIILIIVIGAQATDAMTESAEQPDGEPTDVLTPQRAAACLETDINQLASRISHHAAEINYRRKERDRMH